LALRPRRQDTHPYWNWPRWERELDWLAMHGHDMSMDTLAAEAIGR
jgi:alpha-N-acetylglucosaminidase